jgi:hypothetical protein
VSARRLDAVLRVRSLREQLARGDVARQRAILAARQDREARALAAIRSADRSAAVAASLFLARRAMLAGGARDAKAAGEATAVARDELEAAAEHWRAAAQRLDGIERLVDRLTKEAELDEQRETANELDDLVLARRSLARDRRHVA